MKETAGRLRKPAAGGMMESRKENHIMDYEKTGTLIQAAGMEKGMTQALDLSVLELLDGERQAEAPLSSEEKEASFTGFMR